MDVRSFAGNSMIESMKGITRWMDVRSFTSNSMIESMKETNGVPTANHFVLRSHIYTGAFKL